MFQVIRKNMKSQKGFTLVELMVVIAIIGVLAAIAVPKFTSSKATANGAKIAADLRTIDSGIAMYAATNSKDPTTVDQTMATTVLNTWPVPPSGDFIFAGKGYTLATGAVYTIDTGRAHLIWTGAAVGSATAGASKADPGGVVEDLGK